MKLNEKFLFCLFFVALSLCLTTVCFSKQLTASDVSQIKENAAQGLPESQYNLGLLLEKGEGGTQSYVEAVKWYKRAAKGEVLEAQVNLANIYATGQEGVPQDLSEAARWFEDAANQGDAQSQYNLGALHQFGIAVPQSYERAAFLYQKAADQGLGDAYLNLGKLYYNGLGVKQDYVKAALLYQKAAAQKMPEACFELGRLHENPNAGYYHAPSKSMGWYKEAYLLGHPEGEENYRRLYQVVYTGVQKAAEDFEKDRKRRAQDALSKDYSRMTTAAIVTGVLIMLAMNEKEYYRVQQHQHTYDNTSQGYKECAQNAINHLIVECSAGLQIFDGSGNAVDGLDIDCNKGAWDCKGIIQNIGKVGYFYCEIANSRNLSDNRDEVIRNICKSK